MYVFYLNVDKRRKWDAHGENKIVKQRKAIYSWYVCVYGC